MKKNIAIVAGGCFWGVEYYFKRMDGVITTSVGYIGGHQDNPNYQEVCSHNTGHLEALKIEFDATKTDYESVLKLFFEIHDSTQANGQGPDIGPQYLSAIFYLDDNQKRQAEQVIGLLKDKGINPVTKLLPATTFWPAEDYHQNYYEKQQKQPYCHTRRKIFE